MLEWFIKHHQHLAHQKKPKEAPSVIFIHYVSNHQQWVPIWIEVSCKFGTNILDSSLSRLLPPNFCWKIWVNIKHPYPSLDLIWSQLLNPHLTDLQVMEFVSVGNEDPTGKFTRPCRLFVLGMENLVWFQIDSILSKVTELLVIAAVDINYLRKNVNSTNAKIVSQFYVKWDSIVC